MTVSADKATADGSAPDGTLDPGGNAVVGGFHFYNPSQQPLPVTDNVTEHNDGCGIWAQAGGIEPSGNVSIDDQQAGCPAA